MTDSYKFYTLKFKEISHSNIYFLTTYKLLNNSCTKLLYLQNYKNKKQQNYKLITPTILSGTVCLKK